MFGSMKTVGGLPDGGLSFNLIAIPDEAEIVRSSYN